MKVTLLGTGSPIPDPNRAGPSTLVQAGATNIVVDCGRGLCMRLVGALCPPGFVNTVFITHLHSDHICALNDLITSRWITVPAATPLKVYGPVGTRKMMDGLLAMLDFDQQYRLDHHADLNENGPMKVEVIEVAPGDAFEIDDVHVTVHRTDHRPVAPTVGFRVEHDGKVAVLAGDTIPCAEVDEMCRDADVYVQTVLRDDLVRAVAPMLPIGDRMLDILDYHSTVEQAGQTAARAGVKTLVLTHYVPPMQPGAEDEWRQLAATHFTGEIVLGPDLTSVEV